MHFYASAEGVVKKQNDISAIGRLLRLLVLKTNIDLWLLSAELRNICSLDEHGRQTTH